MIVRSHSVLCFVLFCDRKNVLPIEKAAGFAVHLAADLKELKRQRFVNVKLALGVHVNVVM